MVKWSVPNDATFILDMPSRMVQPGLERRDGAVAQILSVKSAKSAVKARSVCTKDGEIKTTFPFHTRRPPSSFFILHSALCISPACQSADPFLEPSQILSILIIILILILPPFFILHSAFPDRLHL